MTALGDVLVGFIGGVMTFGFILCAVVWRREDREQALRDESWESIMEVHDDSL